MSYGIANIPRRNFRSRLSPPQKKKPVFDEGEVNAYILSCILLNEINVTQPQGEF